MRILITDKVHPVLVQTLSNKGWSIEYNDGITIEEVHGVIHRFEGVIINSKIIMDRKLIDKGVNLSFIARLGSGMEIVDIPYARSKNIQIINAPEGNANAVGEHAMGMLLMLANNLLKGHQEVTSFIWDREGNRGFELEGKTVGIIGVGHTGSAFASKLQGWGLHILGYDKYKAGFGINSVVEETSLEKVTKESDIISFHLPLSEETIGMCNLDFLKSCKPGVIIINTSRGQVIRTQDLIDCLEIGHVSGACLDVFENEKPATYTPVEKAMYTQLFSFPNVITSPHVAGWTHQSLQRIAELILERIENGYTLEG